MIISKATEYELDQSMITFFDLDSDDSETIFQMDKNSCLKCNGSDDCDHQIGYKKLMDLKEKVKQMNRALNSANNYGRHT